MSPLCCEFRVWFVNKASERRIFLYFNLIYFRDRSSRAGLYRVSRTDARRIVRMPPCFCPPLPLTRRPQCFCAWCTRVGRAPSQSSPRGKDCASEGTESPIGGQGRPEAICKVSTSNHSALRVITGPSWLLDAVQVVVLKDMRSHNRGALWLRELWKVTLCRIARRIIPRLPLHGLAHSQDDSVPEFF